jgi:predicted DNA-binding transcriptional regulator AlpA
MSKIQKQLWASTAVLKSKKPVATPSRFIFRPEVIDRVGVAYVTIWQWMRTGQFPVCRDVGGKAAWLEADVDNWIASRPLRKHKKAEA